MLIYSRDKEGQLQITEITHSSGSSDVNTYKTNMDKVCDRHKPWIKKMKSDQIFVSGNTSVIGNGIFKDTMFTQYTGIKSIHGMNEAPKETLFEAIEKLDQKFKKLLENEAKDLENQRQYQIKNELAPLSFDKIDEILGMVGKRLNEEKEVEIDKLKKKFGENAFIYSNLIERYDDNHKVPSNDAEYEYKYEPGNHYNIASKELRNNDTLDIVVIDKGVGVAIGSISTDQEKRLEAEGVEKLVGWKDIESFSVSESEYKSLIGEFKRMKDNFIDANIGHPLIGTPLLVGKVEIKPMAASGGEEYFKQSQRKKR